MIPRKQMQFLLYALCIIFESAGENDFEDVEGINDSVETFSLGRPDYPTPVFNERNHHIYQKQSTNGETIVEFPYETTEFMENELQRYDSGESEIDLVREESNYMLDFSEESGKNDSVEGLETTESPVCDGEGEQIGEVTNLNHSEITSNTIKLTWNPPMTNHPSCVSYAIIQCPVEYFYQTSLQDNRPQYCNNESLFNVTTTEFIAKELDPCTEYLFIVMAMKKTNSSSGSKINLRTKSLEPGPIQTPTVKSNDPFSLHVLWEPPEEKVCNISHYLVIVNPEKIKMNVTATNVTIEGLNACFQYGITIKAITEDDVLGEEITIEEETKPLVSQPPVADTTDPIISVNSIVITWKVNNESNNNCTLESIKTICNYTQKNGYGYEPRNGETETKIDARVIDNSVISNSTVENVSPYTTYMCWAYAINRAGHSEYSETINLTTLEDVPSAPKFNYTKKDSKITFVWEKPEYLAGILRGFEITLNWMPLFPIPSWCPKVPVDSASKNISGEKLTYELKTLNNVAYTAKIRARTTPGPGNYSEQLMFESQSGVPDVVTNLTHEIRIIDDESNILNLTWSLPCSLNGIFDYFNISVRGTRKENEPHEFSLVKHVSIGKENFNDTFFVNFTKLKGEYVYTFNVSAKVINVDELGAPANLSNIIYPAGIPPQPDEKYIKSITMDAYKTRRTSTSAVVFLPLFPNTNGDIIYYSIIVSEMGYNTQRKCRFDLGRKCTNISSWKDAMKKNFKIPYQATKPCWDPNLTGNIVDYWPMQAIKYSLGEDTDCEELSFKSKEPLFCNGPLKPDTWYHVRARAFTRGGFNDSEAFIVKTNAEINVGIVIGIIFGILFLGILTTIMLLVRQCSPHAILRRFLHSDMPGSPVPAPFTRKKFIAHCQQLVDNPGKLSNEFRLLQTLSVDLQMPTNSAFLQANRKKNRYSDILPYDFSRVKLEVIDNDPNTDYINASFIRGYTGEDEYIACQGPKEETTYDFWRMVDQYNVNIIIMLTQLVEKGKEKCHQYFPTIRETFRYENMTIRCTSELDYRTYTQRTLALQKGNKKRNIMHLHFKDWPDHDVPEDFDPMIHFCQIVRRNVVANEGVVIHCSAGIGRTGTLIAIDILLQHLRDNRKLDVFGTVYRLRHHRINMVQRESQYAYIYNCIKQVLRNPYCLKTYKPPPVDAVYENTDKRAKTVSQSNTNLVNDFETLKKRNFFVSMDSIRPFYDVFSWTSKNSHPIATKNCLRYCKSTSALDETAYRSSLGESDSMDCLIYEVLQNSANEPDTDDLNKDATTSSISINKNVQI